MSKFKFEAPTDPRFLATKYVVEANSFEQLALWKEWHEKVPWKEDTVGLMIQVGILFAASGIFPDPHPVMIHCSWGTINDMLVMFYESTSLVTHMGWVEEFALEACGLPKSSDPGPRPQCDANNFFHCVQATGWSA